MPKNPRNEAQPSEDDPLDLEEPTPKEPDAESWDVFLPDDEPELLPDQSDFWIERDRPF